MLEACARVIDLPPGDPSAEAPCDDLLVVSAMGTLWACCRARLSDSLSAMESLVRIAFDRAVELAAEAPVAERAELINRASRTIHRISSAHSQASALSYDRYLLQQIEQANAEDRTRLARDIHDRLGNSLVLAFRHLELHRAKSATGREVGDRHMAAIERSLNEATDFTRSLISGLRAEAPLTNLVEALVSCAATLNFRKLPVHIAVHGDETWLPDHYRDELFLVVREFLRNSFAHAEPDTITVQVGISPRRVDIEALDDGRGFAQAAQPQVPQVPRQDRAAMERPVPSSRRGSGLAGMQERVEALGGQFSLSSTPGKGTRMRVWVPLPKRAPEAEADGGLVPNLLMLDVPIQEVSR